MATSAQVNREPRIWLTKYIALQQILDKDLARVLERASRDAEKRIKALAGASNVGAVVERTQALAARREILLLLADVWDKVGNQTKAGQARAAALALDVGFEWDKFLFTRVGLSKSELAIMKTSFEASSIRNVQAAIARMAHGPVGLSSKVYKSRQLSEGLVERMISSAVLRGRTVAQLADDVRDSIRPDTPGGVGYAAKRLARTEINAAYHALSADQNIDKPWLTGMGWHTSRSHPKPDICNLYADNSPYQPGSVPKKPHPHCLCYIAPETVDPAEFVRNYRAGAYDDYISSTYGRTTKRVA